MTPPLPEHVMRQARHFAEALGKLKAQHEQHLGCTLTPDEVDAMIWAVKNLRSEARP
jgi:hypothetical protein